MYSFVCEDFSYSFTFFETKTNQVLICWKLTSISFSGSTNVPLQFFFSITLMSLWILYFKDYKITFSIPEETWYTDFLKKTSCRIIIQFIIIKILLNSLKTTTNHFSEVFCSDMYSCQRFPSKFRWIQAISVYII